MNSPANSGKRGPRIVFINQVVGPLFLELVEDLTECFGSSRLVTGTLVNASSPAIVVRLAPAYDRRTLLSRLLTWLKFLVTAAVEIWRADSAAVLLVVSNPPMLPWLAWLAHKLRHQQYIVLVYDIYPDVLIGLNRLSPNSLLARCWRLINRVTLSNAAQVVTIGSHMASSLVKYVCSEADTSRIGVIPTWADTDRFKPLAKSTNEFALRHGQEDRMTVLYSGNLGFSHDIQLVIDAAIYLSDQPNISFLIIGDGPAREGLMTKASAARLTNVTFLQPQSENVLPLSLSTADISIVSIGLGAEKLMMPSKTYYAMAVGSALIGLSQPPNDLSDTLQVYQCGNNVSPGDLQGLVSALQRFRSDPDYLLACRTNARKAAVGHFSRKHNTAKFAKLIQSSVRHRIS